MDEPEWVELEALLPLHSAALAAHGGEEGLRDAGLLASALQRPVNRFNYDGLTDLCALAATYALAITANHPFLDGNKRAAFVCLALFLRLNGLRLAADQVEATHLMWRLASGEVEEDRLADWIRAHTHPAT